VHLIGQRYVHSRVSSSYAVDISWRDGAVVSGNLQFNLNLDRGHVEDDAGTRKVVDWRLALLPMEGKVKPFVESVGLGVGRRGDVGCERCAAL